MFLRISFHVEVLNEKVTASFNVKFIIVLMSGHLTGCGGADPHNSLTSASSAS